MRNISAASRISWKTSGQGPFAEPRPRIKLSRQGEMAVITISLCMIVRDEEDVIARCLDSVSDLADEIIVVDTGSDDRTREIARAYTDRLYDFEWIDDFAAARNFSFSKASMQYCMWLDADDIISEKDRAILTELKNTLSPDVDVVMARYNTGFDEKGNVTFSYYRERLLKNDGRAVWTGAVHEVVPAYGKVIHSDFAVTHKKLHPSDPERNLRILEKVLREAGALCPREQFYYARELYYHGKYRRAADVYEQFLSGGTGWLENRLDACRQLAYCRYAIGEDDAALSSLLRSLRYDRPRAEICCDIGKHFFDREQYGLAEFWYRLALTRGRDDRRGGFVEPDCYHYIPCIQLCVCYDRMGDHFRARVFNEEAGRDKPESPAYLNNRAYFEKIFGKKAESDVRPC